MAVTYTPGGYATSAEHDALYERSTVSRFSLCRPWTHKVPLKSQLPGMTKLHPISSNLCSHITAALQVELAFVQMRKQACWYDYLYRKE